LLLCFVLLNFQKAGFALSYWDAIFEIGFNPDDHRIDTEAGIRQIERLIKFRNAVHAKPVFDEKLDTEIRQVESRISSLDAGNLYLQLPYFDRVGVWRGIGIQGGLEDDHYRLSISDPDIENWAESSSKAIPELWGPREKFGDFGLRVFIRPTINQSFRFKTIGHLHIDDLRLANVIRIFKQLLNTAWSFAKEGKQPAVNFFKGRNFNDQSLRVLYSLATDFPRLFAFFNQYFTIESVVSEEEADSISPIIFDIAISVNLDKIKKDYPYLGALLGRLKGKLNFAGTFYDVQNRPIGSVAFDGDQYFFSTRFKTQEGCFLLQTENANDASEPGLDLTALGYQRFYLIHSFRLNLVGVNLSIEGLKVNLDYFYDDDTAMVEAELREYPEDITADGLILGFLPIWLIDLFIPSNIEDMTQDFFQTLASGNNGEGLSIIYGGLPKESIAGNLWFLTDAEVMSNGVLKFAFNLQRKMVGNQDKLLEDIRVFAQQLWKAFYLDFLRIKLVNFDSE
jgi:hypothetical protein